MIFIVIILIKLIVSNRFLYSYFLNRILRELYLCYYEYKKNKEYTDKYKNRTIILFFEFIFNWEIYKIQILSIFDFYEFMRTLLILFYIHLRIHYKNYRNSNSNKKYYITL
jgi:hypothetical protein